MRSTRSRPPTWCRTSTPGPRSRSASTPPASWPSYTAVIYVGSTYDEPVPVAFLDDVDRDDQAGHVDVRQHLAADARRDPNFATTLRVHLEAASTLTAVAKVDYKGTSLTRDTINQGPASWTTSSPTRPRSTVLGDGGPRRTAPRSRGRCGRATSPTSARSRSPTSPTTTATWRSPTCSTTSLAPQPRRRHRALVRIEDVGPDADPAELRAVADYLSSKKVPFTVAVYPRYRDPKGVQNGGKAAGLHAARSGRRWSTR